jgi:hypothetical protein
LPLRHSLALVRLARKEQPRLFQAIFARDHPAQEDETKLSSDTPQSQKMSIADANAILTGLTFVFR